MNLELIRHSVDTYEFDSPEEETETILKQIRDAKKELELIKRSLSSGIAFMHRTGSDEGLQEAYTDLDAFLNPEIYEPIHPETDPEIDYEARYNAIIRVAEAHDRSDGPDVDDIAKGSYQQGLNDALDSTVRETVLRAEEK